jgi:hypothetical protein
MRPMTWERCAWIRPKLRASAPRRCRRVLSMLSRPHDLPLPKAPEAAIIARNSTGIGGMSAETQPLTIVSLRGGEHDKVVYRRCGDGIVYCEPDLSECRVFQFYDLTDTLPVFFRRGIAYRQWRRILGSVDRSRSIRLPARKPLLAARS